MSKTRPWQVDARAAGADGGTVPREFRTKRAAYDHVKAVCDDIRNGRTHTHTITIRTWDTRLTHTTTGGWTLYETIHRSDIVSQQPIPPTST